MKAHVIRFSSLAGVTAFLAGFAGCAFKPLPPAEPKATIRAVRGSAAYVQNGAPGRPKPGRTLTTGAVISTAADSEVYVSVNGVSSAIAVFPLSELGVEKMVSVGTGPTNHRETVLDLKQGSILGLLKKLANDSSYKIRTPNGVATILGGDFFLRVLPPENGVAHVIFASAAGAVSVTAEQKGQTKIVELHSGEQCEVGKEFSPIKPFTYHDIDIHFDEGGCIFPQPPVAPPAIQQPFNGNGQPRLVNVPLAPTHR